MEIIFESDVNALKSFRKIWRTKAASSKQLPAQCYTLRKSGDSLIVKFVYLQCYVLQENQFKKSTLLSSKLRHFEDVKTYLKNFKHT